MRRYIIRDIETKKIKFINYKKLDFNSITSATDFLSWMQFGIGKYYEVYDTSKQEVVFSYDNLLTKRRTI